MSVSKSQVHAILEKCKKNPIFFIKNFIYIQHPIRGKIRFELYPYQEELFKDFINHKQILVNKSRQLGVSTLAAALSVWYCYFQNTKKILVIATKRDVAQNFVEKCKFMYHNLPSFFKETNPLSKDNTQEIQFKTTDSVIKAIPTSKDAGRSEAATWLIIDEFAFMNFADEIVTSIFPVLASGGRCLIISSPDGTGNKHYELYAGGKSGENDFHVIDLPWNVDPSRDEKWMQGELRKFGKKKFDQEYNCSFESNSNTYISPETMDFIKDTLRPVVQNWKYGSRFKQWELPLQSEQYVVGVDVSSGKSSDFSTAIVVKASTNEQVAEFHGKIDTSDFAQVILEIGKEYNNAIVAIESNNLGDSVLKKIRDDYSYPRLLFFDRAGKPVVANSYDGFNDPGLKAGFSTQGKSRAQILDSMNEGISKKNYIIRSESLLNEFKTFVWKGDKPDHEKNRHSDLIMAYAIGMYTRENCLNIISKNIKIHDAMVAGFGTLCESTSDFGSVFNFGDKTTEMEQAKKLGIYSPNGPIEMHIEDFIENRHKAKMTKQGRIIKKVKDPFNGLV